MMTNTMKAVFIERFGGPEVLKLGQRPMPEPRGNQVLIKVHAASVNPRDWLLREGRYQFHHMLRFPIVPGSDVAGTVAAIGPAVDRFKLGDEVFAMQTMWGGMGAYAEYVLIREDAVATKPKTMSFTEAAALPLGALTAWRGLHLDGHLQEGQRVLVIGASGSVGANAVQLARLARAHVTGVCSSANAAMVKDLGADEVIDYRTQDFRDSQTPWDLIFDCVGKHSLARCEKVLTPNGYYVTTVPNGRNLREVVQSGMRGLFGGSHQRARMVLVRSDSSILDLVASLVDAGFYRAVIDKVYPLEQVAEAHQYSRTMHTRGKLILQLQREQQTK